MKQTNHHIHIEDIPTPCMFEKKNLELPGFGHSCLAATFLGCNVYFFRRCRQRPTCVDKALEAARNFVDAGLVMRAPRQNWVISMVVEMLFRRGAFDRRLATT